MTALLFRGSSHSGSAEQHYQQKAPACAQSLDLQDAEQSPVLCNGDLVECRRRTNHDDTWNILVFAWIGRNHLPQAFVVMLKSGDYYVVRDRLLPGAFQF